MRVKNNILFMLMVFLLNVCSFFCAVEKSTMETDLAWGEIYTAIDYKSKECAGRPSYLLPVFENPDSYSVHLCSLSIINSVCPFTNYPVFCLEMLGVDLPLIGP